jgi:hypothetical protein
MGINGIKVREVNTRGSGGHSALWHSPRKQCYIRALEEEAIACDQ